MSVMSEGAELAIGSTAAAAGLREPSIASVGDYIALMKPRVMFGLSVFAALLVDAGISGQALTGP